MRVGRADAPLTLNVWAQQDYSHLAARPAIADAFTTVFDDWARAHPGVQLRVSVMPGAGAAQGEAAARGGGGPAARRRLDRQLLAAAAEERRPAARGVLARRGPRATFCRSRSRRCPIPAGHVYGLWHETDCRVLFYRKDLVPVPPRTWDELLDDGEPGRARAATSPAISTTPAAGRRRCFDHLAMFWAQGGELVDAGGRPIFGDEPNRRAMLRLLGFLRDTIQRGASPRSVLGTQRLSAADRRRRRRRRRDVSRRQLAAEGSAGRARRRPTSRSGTSRRFRRPTPTTRSTGTGGWVWVVFARDPARQRAAIEFIRDVEAPAHAARISEATGHLPVRRSVYRDFPIFSQDRWYRRFGEMLVDGHARPTVPIYPEISAAPAAGDRHRWCPARRRRTQALDEAWRAVNARIRASDQRRGPRRRGAAPIALAWMPIVLAVVVSGRDVLASRPRRAGARRVGAAGRGARDDHPDLSDARPVAAVADRRDGRRQRAIAYTLESYRRPARRRRRSTGWSA